MISETDSTETMVREVFERLLGSEPPLRVDARVALERGRHAARHRVAYRSVALAAALATATAVVATVQHGGTARHTAASVATTSPAKAPAFLLTSAHGEVARSDGGPPQSALDAKIIAAIRSASPSGWVFEFGGGGTNASSVDGTADDGSGPGRVYVYAAANGMLTREPCADPEFVAGSTCTETHLAGDVILSVRGLVDFQGIQTYVISLTHPDGSGVGAEAGNFTIPSLPKGLLSSKQLVHLTRPTVTRTTPTFSADRLAAVVEAVDTAMRP